MSNLAWNSSQDAEALALLAEQGVAAVEIAPTRIAPWNELTPALLKAARTNIEAFGLVVSSLQAVLFSRPELQLLDTLNGFADFVDHMRRVAEIGAGLGARVVVFGAPRNRLMGGMPANTAWNLARERLLRLGEIMAQAGLILGIEPVPEAYGGEFLTMPDQVIRMVREVDHEGIGVHLDTGCALLGNADIAAAVEQAGSRLCHFHAAEPHLGPFTVPVADHHRAASALSKTGYSGFVAIEMREQPNGMAALLNALDVVRSAATE